MPVENLDEANKITDALTEELSRTTGIGLAANQIGINKRVFITRFTDRSEPETAHIVRKYANPEILKLEEPMVFEEEGCLSFPTLYLNTLRYGKVKIKNLYDDAAVELIGIEAVIFQHEYNHLEGKILPDFKVKDIGPNDRCPCRSGRKFKVCCKPILAHKGIL